VLSSTSVGAGLTTVTAIAAPVVVLRDLEHISVLTETGSTVLADALDTASVLALAGRARRATAGRQPDRR